MKSLTIIVVGILVIVWLLGCSNPDTEIQGKYETYSIEKVEFEGHRYIVLNGYKQHGIEHDPNCECHK